MKPIDRLLVVGLVAALLFVGTRLSDAQSASTVRIYGTTTTGRQVPVLVDTAGVVQVE